MYVQALWLGYGQSGQVLARGIRMTEVKNKIDIQEVLKAVQISEPQDFSVTWEYPGYIAISKKDMSIQIAFGDSLDDECGYTWNAIDIEGRELGCGSFEDLGSIQAIVVELWTQTAELVAL
jgi:hypothetical protein